MLVISRKEEQSVFIGADVSIRILKVAGNRVSLGIDAPIDIRVMRCDAYIQIGESGSEDIGELHVDTRNPTQQFFIAESEATSSNLTLNPKRIKEKRNAKPK